MRRLFMLILTVVLWAGALPLAAQDAADAPSVPMDKGQEIFTQVIKTLGGEEFLQVTDIVRRGRLYSFNRGDLSSAGERFVDYLKFPGMERLELGKDGKIVYLNNRDEGWELDRQGVRDMSPEAIENFNRANKRDYEYLLRYRSRGEKMTFYYQGREFVDNRRADILELVDKDGESTTLVVDARTFLPMQIRYREKDILSGEWVDVLEYFGKYITVQGIKTPMQFTRERAKLRSLEVYFSEVQYNTGLSDDFFTRASLEQHWQKVK